jgi:hypothetical protein
VAVEFAEAVEEEVPTEAAKRGVARERTVGEAAHS